MPDNLLPNSPEPPALHPTAEVTVLEPRPPFPIASGYSKKRLAVALAIAGVSDVISAFTTFAPPIEWVVDLSTALLLFLVLGWRWLLLPALIMEAIPGVGAVPFWVLVVGAIAIWGTPRPKLN